MGFVRDLTGQRFGKLSVIERAPNSATSRSARWLCVCDCGQSTVTYGSHLTRGLSKSCGCRRAEVSATVNLIHGKKQTTEYRSWCSMKTRCSNPNSQNFRYYGGRGIKVCDRWRESFVAFLEDMGPKPTPGHSIDRIDPDGDYAPSNCRWATRVEQRANRRDST